MCLNSIPSQPKIADKCITIHFYSYKMQIIMPISEKGWLLDMAKKAHSKLITISFFTSSFSLETKFHRNEPMVTTYKSQSPKFRRNDLILDSWHLSNKVAPTELGGFFDCFITISWHLRSLISLAQVLYAIPQCVFHS